MTTLQLHKFCEAKQPKQLVFMLHGYGANGENLIDLAHQFRDVLPQAHFIAPNAIEPWEGGFPNAYQWFSLSSGFERRGLQAMAEDIKKSQQKLQELIDEQLRLRGLSAENLWLVGFSQGAMMAIYQALMRPQKIAGVIGFSGRFIAPEMLGEKTLTKPEICLIHGQQDSVVPFDSMIEAEKLLKAQNFSCETHAIPNLDHSIDLRAVRAASSFLKRKQSQIINS